jgi:type I restriction enzyme S subunit
MARGVNINNLKRDNFESISLPLAPAAEQKRIADKLDALLAKVDACRRRLDRVPALIKRFRQAVLAAATAGELTADWRELHGVDESSIALPLKELVKIDVGFAFKSSEFRNEGVRLLRGDNIEPGKLRWLDAKCFDPEKLVPFKHLMLNEGDVILAMDRPLISTGLKLARVRKDDLPCVLVQRVCRFQQNSSIDANYLYFTLSDKKFIDYLREEQNGTQIPHISGAQILGFPISIRSLDEQKEIVRRVEALFAFADRLEARYLAARKQVDALTPALLSKAFRGELVPQDPNDEPASALLERIRAERAGQGALFDGAPKRRRKTS